MTMLRKAFAASCVLAPALLAAGCSRQTVASDGYRGRLVRGVADSTDVAARGEMTRLTRLGGTGEIWITIRRPDLGKMWNYRPLGRYANKVIESKLRAPSFESYWDEIPPTPAFDVEKYAEMFHGSARFRDHLFFAEHPCDVYDVTFFKGGVDRIWLATDLGRLPVRVQRGILVEGDTPNAQLELRPRVDLQLAQIEAGAPRSLFELPAAAAIIPDPNDQ